MKKLLHIRYYCVVILPLLMLPTSILAQVTAKNMQNDLFYRLGKLNDYQNTDLSSKASFNNSDSNLSPFYVNGLYERAHKALILNQEDADFLLETFISQYPNHPLATRANYIWGEKYFQLQNYTKAIHYLLKAPPQNLEYTEGQKLKLMLGQSYFYLAEGDDKEEYYEKANFYFSDLKADMGIQKDTSFFYDASYYSGYIHYTKGEYEEAVLALRQAEESDKYKLAVPILIASVYYQQEEFYELTTYSEEVLEDFLDYDQADKLNLLTAESFYREDEFNQAIYYYGVYFNLTGETPKPETYFQYGFTLYEDKNYQAATDKFKKVVETQPDSELGQYAAYYAGLCYLEQNGSRLYDAIPALEQARRYNYDPKIEENATFLLGQVYYDVEQYEDAINTLSIYQSLRRGSQADDTRLNLAKSLIAQSNLYNHNYNQVIAYLDKADNKSFEQNRIYQKATFNQAVEDFNNGQYTTAIKNFEKSIFTPNAENDLTHQTAYWLAESYSLNDYDSDEQYRDYLYSKAIPYYQEVIKFYSRSDSLYAKAIYGMAYALFNLKEYESAIPFFQQYSDLGQRNNHYNYYGDAQLRLADCFYATRNYAEALKYYNIAISEETVDLDYAYLQRGMISQIFEERQNTLDSYNIIIEKEEQKVKENKNYYPSPYYQRAILQRGILNLDDSRYSVSIQDFSTLINDYPNSWLVPEALLNRGFAYEEIRDNYQAINDFKSILTQYPTSYQAQDALLTLQDLLEDTGQSAEFPQYVTIFNKANPKANEPVSLDFNKAKDTFLDEKYDQAIPLLTDIITKYPESGLQFDTKFYLAESYYRRDLTGDRESALNNYLLVIQDKQSQFVAKAYQRCAKISLENQDFQSAIQYYTQLVGITNNKRLLKDAWSGIMESYYEINLYDSTLFYADLVMNRTDMGILKDKAQLYRAKANYQLGNKNDAKADFEYLTNHALGKIAAESQYFFAKILSEQQSFEASSDLLFDLNARFSAYEYWRGQSSLLIADNYIGQNDMFLAKSTLETIIENSDDSTLVAAANEKLNSL